MSLPARLDFRHSLGVCVGSFPEQQLVIEPTVPAGGIAALHTCNVRVVHAVYTDLTCQPPHIKMRETNAHVLCILNTIRKLKISVSHTLLTWKKVIAVVEIGLTEKR